ncbi:MAG: SsrA-binding protein SmpB [Deltaproteobacteria bacterium]|nr:SsrA-binding protein SmpB [Deltaproteobacteria bacterium]
MTSGIKIISENRKARFNYEILERVEAGIVLKGSEVKSLREGKAQLVDSYAGFIKGELWLLSAHIAKYPAANQFNHEETRERKLLMHRRELDKLVSRLQEKGLSLVPLKLYFKKGRVKVELGLGRGKKIYDKRDTKKKRESEREISRMMKR